MSGSLRGMIRTYTQQELAVLKREAFAKGREDALLGLTREAYPANSVGSFHYRNGFGSGKVFRAFLDARGMAWTQQIVTRGEPSGWTWVVKVEGEIKATGSASSEKKANLAAEAAALKLGEKNG